MQLNIYLYSLFMIYVLKIMWYYQVPLLELIVRNIARYPQSATSTLIRYQPAICYLLNTATRPYICMLSWRCKRQVHFSLHEQMALHWVHLAHSFYYITITIWALFLSLHVQLPHNSCRKYKLLANYSLRPILSVVLVFEKSNTLNFDQIYTRNY